MIAVAQADGTAAVHLGDADGVDSKALTATSARARSPEESRLVHAAIVTLWPRSGLAEWSVESTPT